MALLKFMDCILDIRIWIYFHTQVYTSLDSKFCLEKVWVSFYFFFETQSNALHTYIIGHYNPSVKIIDLVSHITYVVCVNFIHKRRDLQFKVDSERQIFLRNFSWQFYFTLRVFARNQLRGNRRRNTFRIYFDVWPGARTLAFRLISQHTSSSKSFIYSVFIFHSVPWNIKKKTLNLSNSDPCYI